MSIMVVSRAYKGSGKLGVIIVKSYKITVKEIYCTALWLITFYSENGEKDVKCLYRKFHNHLF